MKPHSTKRLGHSLFSGLSLAHSCIENSRTTGRRFDRCRNTGKPRRRLNRTAATLVEFAIVSNVFLVTIFTCMEFARMNMARNLAQDAAYMAARTAIVPGATPAEAEAEATRIMNSILPSGFTVTCSPITEETEEVSVRVAVRLDDVALFIPLFLGGIELESVATMQTERYSGFYQQ